ncbi:MAG: hypothetical protein ACYSSL_02280 [Planctomycetota bacterium]|jgi:hypothetical protein
MERVYKGRILRVKTGYNPNSSSVGSLIPTFLAFAAGVGAVTVVVMNILSVVNKHICKKKKSFDSEAEK